MAENQEREFRVFAKRPNEVRLRYKPMQSAYRRFLHVLAEDYGLESRSEDVEPHRYVIVFKGPCFVSAPSKTLAQCVRIREAQAAEASAAAVASRPQSTPSVPVNDPFNGILTSPRFGLTIEEVNAALGDDLASQPSIHFAVSFLPTEKVFIRATTHYSASLSPAALEQALAGLKPRLAEAIERTGVAGNVVLCRADSDEHVSRREGCGKTNASGWSAVAGRAAARSQSATPVEDPPSRSGRKLLSLRKKNGEGGAVGRSGGDSEC